MTALAKAKLAAEEYEGQELIRGLPSRLPEGERILWQGAPNWWALSRRAFHVTQLAAYFGAITAWYAVLVVTGEGSALDMLISIAKPVGAATVALALLTALGWLTARTTVYTVTNRRLVLRFGIALPMTINLPFAVVDGAGVRVGAAGTGDIVLKLAASQQLAYAVLWPHARPWRFRKTEPMIRAIPDVVDVAQIVSRALAASAQAAVPAIDAASSSAAPSRPRIAAAA